MRFCSADQTKPNKLLFVPEIHSRENVSAAASGCGFLPGIHVFPANEFSQRKTRRQRRGQYLAAISGLIADGQPAVGRNARKTTANPGGDVKVWGSLRDLREFPDPGS